MERVGWIDFLRGISMIAILVFHTEVYYKEYDVTPYYIYVTNAITLFYFISGYLFYHEQGFNVKYKLRSIVKTLLVPYFIFTTLIAIPKVLARGEAIDGMAIVIKILSGQASWFIVALMVAEVLFSISLYISKGKNCILSTFGLLCLITYTLIPFNQHNYWQWQDALLAVPFLYLGYLYHQYQKYINAFNRPLYSLLLLLILIIIKIYEYDADYPMNNIAITNYPLFLADTLLFILLITEIINYLPSLKVVEWIGKHCIVYYFLAGGCPLIVSMILRKIGCPYQGQFFHFLLAVILVYILSTCLTWFIYQYVPFITGRSKS